MQENIIIIGAGPAGLTAAYKLLKSDKNKYNIKIIEKSNTVSGISKTINMGEKYLVDTGIHRFFSKSEEINTLWNEILPNSFLTKDRITRIYYNKKFFDYPVKLNKNTLKNFGIAKSVRIGFSYLKSCIKKKKEDSLENFYINRFGKVLYEIFFKNYTDPFRNVVAIMINRMLQGKQPIIYGDGEQKRTFSFVDDCIFCIENIIKQNNLNGEVINIGPDKEFITINELAQEIAKQLNFDLKPIYVKDRPNEVKFATCSADKARKLLNYFNQTTLENGIKKMIEDIKEKGPKDFNYNYQIEICNEKTPNTWKNKII